MAAIESWIASGNEIAALWSAHPGKWNRFRRALAHHDLCATKLPDLAAIPPPVSADTLVTAMTHAIVPERLIEMYGGRAINLHPALLPGCKGPAPRQSMLVDGTADREGGVTVHVLTTKIDAGPIIGSVPVAIRAGEDWWSWDRRLAVAAAGLFAGEVCRYLAGLRQAVPQQSGTGRYRKVRIGEFSIGPDRKLDDAQRLMKELRRYPVPLLFTDDGGNKRSVAVETVDKILGRPTGEPAKFDRRSAMVDLADARVRFGRAGRLLKLYRRWLENSVLAESRRIGKRHRISENPYDEV
jgi:methionyl-tRNA formyltransferase